MLKNPGKIRSLFEGTDTVQHFVDYQLEYPDENKQTIADFIEFAKEKLNIKELSNYIFTAKKHNDMSTGCYIPSGNTIKVLVSRRALLDIIRSISHEMVHRMQDETGALDNIEDQGDRSENDMSDVGADFENEANALGGAIVKEWSRKYTKLPKDRIYEI